MIAFLVLIARTDFGKNTLAVFYDRESSQKNKFKAGELDLSIIPASEFSPELKPDVAAEREIKIKNEIGKEFDYKIEANITSGDLCGNLELKAERKDDSSYEYEGDLDKFNFEVEDFSGEEIWKFKAILKNNGNEWENEKCDFEIIVRGGQSNSDLRGFSDYETITNRIESGVWSEQSAEDGDVSGGGISPAEFSPTSVGGENLETDAEASILPPEEIPSGDSSPVE